MKTILSTMINDSTEVSIITDNCLRRFNVRWKFQDKINPEKKYDYYAFPTMVDQIKAMENYSKVTN